MNKTAAIVGTGLIGGSIAKDLKRQEYRIYGIDRNENNLDIALGLNIIDEKISIYDLEKKKVDYVILAIPVQSIQETLPKILDYSSDKTTVIDVGSTKLDICNSIRDHRNRKRFIAAHPIAGTENVGPKGAIFELFKGKQNIICERELSSIDDLEKALNLFEELQMETIFMEPAEHDKHLAYVSHLSHISSFMLGQTVLDIEKSEQNIKMLAGSGFESTVRLAKSSPEMWAPIFIHNKKPVLNALNEYIDHLSRFRDLIESDQIEGLMEAMQKANDVRRILK